MYIYIYIRKKINKINNKIRSITKCNKKRNRIDIDSDKKYMDIECRSEKSTIKLDY